MKGLVASALSFGFLAIATIPAAAQGQVLAWGGNQFGQCNVPVPPSGVSYVQVAAGERHSLALRNDGTVIAWGRNGVGQCNVPVLPAGLVYIEAAAGSLHSLARRSDGSVVAWGDNQYGQCVVPALPPGLTYVELAAGLRFSLARLSDGSVVGWGSNDWGQCSAPALPSGLTYVEVAAGSGHAVARRSDGSVVAWGENAAGQCNVPAPPIGLTYVEIAAGGWHSLARRSDNALVAWGDNSVGQCNVPTIPTGLTCVGLAAGESHNLALLSSGSIIAWGDNAAGQCNAPSLPLGANWAEIAAGYTHSLARADGCFPDADGDGYGDANSPGVQGPCASGFVANWLDCDDTRATVYSGAPELCDGLDNDCDGAIDEGLIFTYYQDKDGDGFGDPLAPLVTCAPPPGYVLDNTDCNDNAPTIHPGAPEPCNGIDDDCDGSTDDTHVNTYCTAGTTSSGCNALISCSGAASATAASGFAISVANVEMNQSGIIFYGLNGATVIPWGHGTSFLCVKPPLGRMGVLNSGGSANACDGVLSIDWNQYIASTPFALGQPFVGGETVWAQAWFRDPPSQKTTALSNGLQFTVCP